jgi:acetyl-CoA acetyltransferase
MSEGDRAAVDVRPRAIQTELFFNGQVLRRKQRYGLASACIGGGQGIAMIVESLS